MVELQAQQYAALAQQWATQKNGGLLGETIDPCFRVQVDEKDVFSFLFVHGSKNQNQHYSYYSYVSKNFYIRYCAVHKYHKFLSII